MALLRLFDPTTQFQTKSGALNVAGKLRIYIESTDDLANIYGDDGSRLPQPLILDSNGRARGLFVDSGRSYRLEAYDRNDSLLFTIRRLEPNASGTIVNPTVFIKGTPDEIDVEDSVTEGSRTYTVALSAKVKGEIDENREAIVKESEARKGADDELRKMIDDSSKAEAGTASPLMDGKASVGNSLKYAREDHVHPSDTSKEDKANKTTVVLGTSDSKYPTDKAVAEFVNSSIATNTANYISNNGEPFTSVEQLEAYSGPVTNNDYAFVTGTDSEGNTYYDRYKATVSGETVTWALEYRLNNSSFTAAQWSAINSGITSALVAKIHDHSNKDVLDGITSDKVNSWNAKQSALTFDTTPTAGSTNPVTSGGIKTALEVLQSNIDRAGAGTASPLMDGQASVGNSLKYAREDHVHPSDTSKEDKANKTTVVLGTSDSKYPTDKAVANFVNSSIATNTANYISNNGEPFTSVEQLNAYSGTVTNNDYAFVTGTDSEGNTYYDRYKATVSGETVTWALEYRLNNSSFTAAQWSAINSGITSVLVAKIHDHGNKDVLDGITSDKVNSWDGKEDAFDILPTTKGGTGTNAASRSELTSALINSLSTAVTPPTDADYYVAQFAGGGTTYTSYHRRTVLALWLYIKGKISLVLGLTASAYSGKAATAGTADKAVADKSGNNIEETYATKTELSTHKGDTTVHITAAERTAWNAKASTSVATTSANGLMSKTDKAKLDGISSGANKADVSYASKKLTKTINGTTTDVVAASTIIRDTNTFGNFAAVTDVTVSNIKFHTYWQVAPTSSNQVYGFAVHPTTGKLYRVYNNKGTYSVYGYDTDTNTTYSFDGTYNSSTNKAATVSSITSRIATAKTELTAAIDSEASDRESADTTLQTNIDTVDAKGIVINEIDGENVICFE